MLVQSPWGLSIFSKAYYIYFEINTHFVQWRVSNTMLFTVACHIQLSCCIFFNCASIYMAKLPESGYKKSVVLRISSRPHNITNFSMFMSYWSSKILQHTKDWKFELPSNPRGLVMNARCSTVCIEPSACV